MFVLTLPRIATVSLALSLAAVNASAQGAPPTTTPGSGGALIFPAATPYGSYKPQAKYDKFADSTRVAMTIMTKASSPGGFLGMGKITPEINVTVGYSFAGKTHPPTDTVRYVAFLVSSKQHDSDHSDVKATVRAPAHAPIIFLLGNGGRERLAADLIDTDVDVFGWSADAIRTSVTYGVVLPVATYLRIVTSGDTVEGRAGDIEFKLDNRTLDALRNFAGHMVAGQ